MNYPWNHGKISRQAAEELLMKNATDGAYLVRESESVAGAHVLSLWFGNMIHHFRVLRNEDKFTVQASDRRTQRYFSNLGEVIDLFKQPGQGLPCELKDPIVKESTNDSDHDSDEDERDDRMDTNEDLDFVDGNEPSDNEAISSLFVTKMSQMDASRIDEEFRRNLELYLSTGFARDGTRINTSTPATDLQGLIVNSATGVSRELKEFLKKIVFLHELFSFKEGAGNLLNVTTASTSDTIRKQSRSISAYEELVDDLAKCVAGVKSLQILAQKAHQQHAQFMKTQQSQTRTFEVNTCGNFKTKAFLKVDITEGKLWFMKNDNDSNSDCPAVDHDRILQMVKDPTTPKLTIKIDNKSTREYVFKDVQDRENLCQLTQYMMNIHSPNRKELKQISVFVGTWNMGSASPPSIDSWIMCSGSGKTIKDQEFIEVIGHDIYAIGTQESSIGENTWISRLKIALKLHFKIDYYTVAAHTLWGIRLIVLAKPEHKNRISRVEKSSVKTGIANKLGNKGGVGISFDFQSTSLCFINTHLASGNEDLRKARRQQNYLDILKGLSLGHKSAYDLTNQFHHVFWFGDLNYRIDMQFEDISSAIKALNYKNLMSEDQLKKEKKLGKVFFEFHESDLYFPPTYRYKRGTRESYDHIKVKRSGTRINVPSWCDRVLWKSFPELPIKQISYGCTNDIVTSDHSPVFASFEVPITSQFVASQDQTTVRSQTNKPSCKIKIESVKAKIQTMSKTNFYLEFHSVCLGASQKSKLGKPVPSWDLPRIVDSSQIVFRYSEWDTSTMPELNPILDDPEYLKEQHLLLAVKSEAGDESYGECVLSLKRYLSNSPQHFGVSLSHGGVKTGEILGKINVQHPKPTTMKKPTQHAKPDAGDRKQTSTIHSQFRPVSCVSPTVSETVPVSKKSLSLGRDPRQKSSFYTGLPQPDLTNESPNMTLPELPKKTKGNTPVNQLSHSESSTPPPLPVKSNKPTSRPTSVAELLSKLGLSCYLSNLEDNGFEDISFLEDISDEDLANTGIKKSEHIKQILNEVELLKKSGVFNSLY